MNPGMLSDSEVRTSDVVPVWYTDFDVHLPPADPRLANDTERRCGGCSASYSVSATSRSPGSSPTVSRTTRSPGKRIGSGNERYSRRFTLPLDRPLPTSDWYPHQNGPAWHSVAAQAKAFIGTRDPVCHGLGAIPRDLRLRSAARTGGISRASDELVAAVSPAIGPHARGSNAGIVAPPAAARPRQYRRSWS